MTYKDYINSRRICLTNGADNGRNIMLLIRNHICYNADINSRKNDLSRERIIV